MSRATIGAAALGTPMTAASTVDLDDLAARVHQLVGQCHARAESLGGAAQLMPPGWHYRMNAIAIQVADIARELETVSRGLASTSQAYADRENVLRGVAHEASSALFWGLGRALALFAPAVIPAVLGGVTALLAASAITGKRPEEIIGGVMSLARGSESAAGGNALTTAISSPQFVEGLEFAVSGIDDFAAGLLGMPLPLISTLGERGLGVSDPSAIAGMIVGVAGGLGGLAAMVKGMPTGLSPTAGPSFAESALTGSAPAGSALAETALVETPVTVTRVSVETASGPQGLEQLIGRIPRADPEMPQVRIERYEGAAAGHPTFIVYLGGTIDAGLMPTDEPWDMTSNVAALAGMDAGSYRAALDAMRAAGIASDDLVTLVGHSQGGLLAARIAQSEEFRVGDVVTVGAPIHQVSVPAGVTVTAIEHTEDLVPTLGGLALGGIGAGLGAGLGAGMGAGMSSGKGEGTTTTVRRSALAGITPSANDSLPGHNLTRYIETGRAMDASNDQQIAALKKRLGLVISGEGQMSLWRADRSAG